MCCAIDKEFDAMKLVLWSARKELKFGWTEEPRTDSQPTSHCCGSEVMVGEFGN